MSMVFGSQEKTAAQASATGVFLDWDFAGDYLSVTENEYQPGLWDA